MLSWASYVDLARLDLPFLQNTQQSIYVYIFILETLKILQTRHGRVYTGLDNPIAEGAWKEASVELKKTNAGRR